jgi:hypothetical protein
LDVAFFLFSGNRIGKKSCRINIISFWREKAGSIAKNKNIKNIDEVKAMSYSCYEKEPGTDMAPWGLSPPLPDTTSFRPKQFLKKQRLPSQQLCPTLEQMAPNCFFFPGPPSM